MALRKRGSLLKFASEKEGTQKGEGGSLRKGRGVPSEKVGFQPCRKLWLIKMFKFKKGPQSKLPAPY